MGQTQTPAAAGFSMLAEWEPHAGCLMAWPSRDELWQGRVAEAKAAYANVARAIAASETLHMVCNPGEESDVRNQCGSDVEVVPAPIDDSWMRDSGPVFVRNNAGELAIVNFEFNAWGERFHPYDSDNRIPLTIAKHLGMPVFDAPLVLEGGSYFTDGEGTLITTEQCLLNPNRNPSMSKAEIEQALCEYLGVTTVVWLPWGHSLDVGPEATDGHVDGIAQYVAPGHIVLEVPDSPESSEYEYGQANAKALEAATDAAGRSFDVTRLDAGPGESPAYCNFYLSNGSVIVPIVGDGRDAPALELLGSLYPGREVVGVPGEVLAFGGGGPHCITQQIPVGPAASL